MLKKRRLFSRPCWARRACFSAALRYVPCGCFQSGDSALRHRNRRMRSARCTSATGAAGLGPDCPNDVGHHLGIHSGTRARADSIESARCRLTASLRRVSPLVRRQQVDGDPSSRAGAVTRSGPDGAGRRGWTSGRGHGLPDTSAAPRCRSLAEQPAASLSDCNVSETVSSKPDLDRQHTLQSGCTRARPDRHLRVVSARDRP